MAKHRRLNKTTTRRVAAASAAVMGATVLAPGVAGAVEVVVPGTDVRVDVQGLDQVQGLQNVPNIEQFVPS
ncbi:MAG: endopeptidase, partial [Corynebacterium sp.]|nr:endopeptidase [Corynebacterium sp.]